MSRYYYCCGLALALLVNVGCQSLNRPCCTTSDCCVTKSCCPEWKKEKVEVTCNKIECEEICIPPIRCPFDDECTPRCGTVIAVKKVKTEKIECGEKCKLEYKLVCNRCGQSGCGCNTSCGCSTSTGCGQTGCTQCSSTQAGCCTTNTAASCSANSAAACGTTTTPKWGDTNIGCATH